MAVIWRTILTCFCVSVVVTGTTWKKFGQEVRGGTYCFVVLRHGRKCPVGRAKAVGSRYLVSFGRWHKELEELVVEWGPVDGEVFVAVRGEDVPRVGGDVHHALVAEWRTWCFVPIKDTVEFLVGGFGVVVPRRAQHVERVLHLWEHFSPQLDQAIVV
jgi:hypothetical protein